MQRHNLVLQQIFPLLFLPGKPQSASSRPCGQRQKAACLPVTASISLLHLVRMCRRENLTIQLLNLLLFSVNLLLNQLLFKMSSLHMPPITLLQEDSPMTLRIMQLFM